MDQEIAYSTREYIMQMLKINGELSTKSITEALGITGMAVRRHLESLKNEGYITYRTVKQPMGRPVSLYSLTESAEDFSLRTIIRLPLICLTSYRTRPATK